MRCIGIDLGTSNTLIAGIDSNGEPEIIEIDGDKMIPSVIYIEETAGNKVVGNGALDMWADPWFDTTRSFRRWKLTMGEGHCITTLHLGEDLKGSIEVTPEMLTTSMVESVVKEISQGDDGEEIESILVTVPHGWRREKPEKCRATRQSAEMAYFKGQNVKVQKITVSEPVAAAAYWLWVTRKNRPADEFINKTMMVCDIGGGTFDISLVLIGDIDKPLDVIDAINNNSAGDYVDALLCAWICRQFNQKHNTKYPETADAVLHAVTNNDIPWLRGWFISARNVKEKFSERAERISDMGKPLDKLIPVKASFEDPSDNHLTLNMDMANFLQCVEPFFEEGRNLLRSILDKVPAEQRPYAVVFAGGGSKIYGVNEKIIFPVIKEFFTEAQTEEILKRITPNKRKLDLAIALGAALIANGVVSVQERLLHNIGMTGQLDSPALIKTLKLPKMASQKILLTPLLKKGDILPVRVTSTELGFPCSLAPGEEMALEIVIDDDSQDPWVQNFVIPHPGAGVRQSLEWVIEADTDGALTIHLQPKNGAKTTIQGKLERQRTGRASIIFAQNSDEKTFKFPHVTPAELIKAMKKLGER